MIPIDPTHLKGEGARHAVLKPSFFSKLYDAFLFLFFFALFNFKRELLTPEAASLASSFEKIRASLETQILGHDWIKSWPILFPLTLAALAFFSWGLAQEFRLEKVPARLQRLRKFFFIPLSRLHLSGEDLSEWVFRKKKGGVPCYQLWVERKSRGRILVTQSESKDKIKTILRSFREIIPLPVTQR